MYEEIIDNLSKQLSREELEYIKSKQLHLGIFIEPGLTDILNEKRTLEIRFSKNRQTPFGKLNNGDIVILKRTGGDVVGYFSIKKAEFFENIDMQEMKEKYNHLLLASEDIWKLKKDSKYATLIFIDKVVSLKPFHINKKGMQTWVIL